MDDPASISPTATRLWDALQRGASRFHGIDERIDVLSLGLTTTLFHDVVRDLMS